MMSSFLVRKPSQNVQIVEDGSCKRDFLQYTSVPTLENIAAVNVVIQLWKQHLRERVHRNGYYFSYDCSEKELAEVFDEVQEKALGNLSELPKQLRVKATYFIRPIGLQVLKWMDHLNADFSCFAHGNSVDFISWTMQGTIDVMKTLEMYFTDIKDIEGAYYIACWYCLEDFIYRLEMQIGPKIFQYSSSRKTLPYASSDIFVIYWRCSIKGQLDKFFDLVAHNCYYNVLDRNRSVHENMIILSIYVGNVAAIKYFWNKFIKNERCRHVIEEWVDLAVKCRHMWKHIECMSPNNHTDVLCFLLMKMSNKMLHRQDFKKYGSVILKALFLDWPWQLIFFPAMELMWDFLDGRVYVDFLSEVVPALKLSKSTEILFKEMWCSSPNKLKKCFVQHMGENEGGIDVLLNLCKTKDHDALKEILMYASVEEKRKIVLSATGSAKLFELFCSDKLTSLKVLVEEVLSECEIVNLKKELIEECGGNLCQFWICENNWQSVEKLLHWCFISDYEIGNFKKEKVDKAVTFSSLVCVGDYELISRFMKWRCSSSDEIKKFEEDLLFGNVCGHYYVGGIIVDLSGCKEGWKLFEKFISCFFSSQDKVNQLKELLTYDAMQDIVFYIIAFMYNFDFCSKFLCWRYSSENEIDQFKRELRLSYRGDMIYETFACDLEAIVKICSYQELLNKLNEWYSPSEKGIV